jgi:RNA polymerase sigma-70 factor (ECF subfamily)
VASAEQVELWAERHGKELHAYLWRLLGDAQDAEDCFQETFLRALRSRGASPVRQPRPWLYAIAGNVARTHLRRRRLDGERWADPPPELAAPDEGAGRERWGEVRSAVEALPEKQRTALMLRRYQGLSYDEVARALGGTPAAARANVYQALRKLREAFPEERP